MEHEILVIPAIRYGDDRGWFHQTWSRAQFAALGISCDFVQDNHSRSKVTGVIRGLHFQRPPFAQAKLVRCVRGAIRDVMVDIRVGAPTFGQVYQVELTEDSGTQVLVPPGFAHGFVTLKPDTEVIYKVSAPYAPDHEGGLAWDDPALAIDWTVPVDAAQLSPRDRNWPTLSQLASPFEGTDPSQLRQLTVDDLRKGGL